MRGLYQCALLIAVLTGLPGLSLAQSGTQGRAAYLAAMLEGSDAFRVRAQSALQLAKFKPNARIAKALKQALRDPHPAVRQAAVSALAKIGQQDALSAVAALRRDRDPRVSRAARRAYTSLRKRAENQAVAGNSYYVQLGRTGAKRPAIASSIVQATDAALKNEIAKLAAVRLAGADESPAEIRARLRRERLTGLFIDASVVSVSDAAGKVRVEVSVVVATLPGRDIRAMLKGAASVAGSGERLAMRAAAGAVTGALRKLPAALNAAAPQRAL